MATNRGSLLILIVLWLGIYAAGMFSPALLDDADTVHAEAAREMVLRHDWVTLYADGIRYLEKAPLPYWCVAVMYKLFGVSEWTTRFPLMLGMLALILATYELGRRVYGEKGGFYSALVMATSLGPYLFTRFMIPDVLVGLWLTIGFIFFLKTLDEKRPSRLACWGLAITTALNVLTKGLIGLVFPVGIIGLYLLLTGNLRHLLRLRIVSSLLILVAISAPWHVLAAWRNPTQGGVRGFLWFYFVNEHFLRYLNKRVPHDYDTVPFLIFWGLLLLWLLPWSAFLPQSISGVFRRGQEWRSHLGNRQRGNLLFFLWALVILVFFSFSTRQEYYTIPAIPALALLVGGWLAREASGEESAQRSGRISATTLLVLGVIASAVGLVLVAKSQAPPPGTDLADLLKENPERYALSFGHFFDLTGRAMGMFRAPLLGASLSFFLGTLLNWWFRRRDLPVRGNLALAAMMLGLLTCVHSAFSIFSPIISSKNLAMAIKKEYRPGDVVVIRGHYERASTLNIYLGVPVKMLHAPAGNLWYGSQFPDAPKVFLTPAEFAEYWNGPAQVFLWTEIENPPELEGLGTHILAKSGGKFVLTNRTSPGGSITSVQVPVPESLIANHKLSWRPL
jgi:4-amino-4-deoxy-L-arabinose transferase-like glycosyltransferase